MKSTQLLLSLAAVSVLWLAAGCSSKSNPPNGDAGAGGSSETGGGGGSGGKGGTSGSGSGGTVGTGGKASGGTHDGGDGGATSDGGPGTGGAPATCPGKNLQTDPENCGSCGKNCAGGDCSGGLCVPVLVMDTQEPPYGFHSFELQGTVSSGKVFLWEKTTRNSDHYKLLSAPSTPAATVSKGEPALQDSPFPPDIGSVTFDATSIYEAIQPTTVGGKGQVVRKSLADNSAPTKVFTLPSGPSKPASDGGGPTDLTFENIAVGKNAIYVTGLTHLNSAFNPVDDHNSIYSMATPVADPASEPTKIVSNIGDDVTDLRVFGNATAGEHLFWIDYFSGRHDSDAGAASDHFVFTAPVAGGTPVLLGDGYTEISSFASDSTYVYWTEANDAGRLMRVPLANLDRAHVTVVCDASSAEEGIIVQGQYAYFMELTDPGPIYRVNTNTGVRELLGNRTVGASVKESYLFGADSNFLYMSSIDGPVYRLPIVP